jgi:hypothetical protein
LELFLIRKKSPRRKTFSEVSAHYRIARSLVYRHSRHAPRFGSNASHANNDIEPEDFNPAYHKLVVLSQNEPVPANPSPSSYFIRVIYDKAPAARIYVTPTDPNPEAETTESSD